MNEKKRRTLRIFFAGELLLFSLFYWVGPQGLHNLRMIKNENSELKKEIMTIEHEIMQLNEQIGHIKTDPFYKEKIAREQLQMARKDEIIYYMVEDTEQEVS